MDQLALPFVRTSPDDGTSAEAPAALPQSADTRSSASLQTTLRQWLGPKVIVKLTDNQSTMISYRTQRTVLYLRLHTMFRHAPEPVLAAVAAFVTGENYGRAEAERLDAWIEDHRPHPASRPRKPARPIGEIHNLQAMFDDLNRRWFNGRIRARITWGDARPHSGRRRSMQLGAYDEDAGEIRIHPALDQAWVPPFFVAAVVFHEMLHEKHDAPLKNGRRQIHSPRFLAEEKTYPDYERARRWETVHLDRLLGY